MFISFNLEVEMCVFYIQETNSASNRFAYHVEVRHKTDRGFGCGPKTGERTQVQHNPAANSFWNKHLSYLSKLFKIFQVSLWECRKPPKSELISATLWTNWHSLQHKIRSSKYVIPRVIILWQLFKNKIFHTNHI